MPQIAWRVTYSVDLWMSSRKINKCYEDAGRVGHAIRMHGVPGARRKHKPGAAKSVGLVLLSQLDTEDRLTITGDDYG